ncbi:MAG: hypothetical protein HZA67_00495 [Rhodospirillales bacterium]|jgi:hypothetical protein|nr:hypothetical protein [Rhodospirillales bacterium]
MAKRKSVLVLAALGAGFLLFGGSLIDAAWKRDAAMARMEAASKWVERLELTDLVLFTEARYTRNLALADRFSAFQDHPMAFEHFPSGSVALPPRHLTRAP